MGQPDVLAGLPVPLLGATHPINDPHETSPEQAGADRSYWESAMAFLCLSLRRAVHPLHRLCCSDWICLDTSGVP